MACAGNVEVEINVFHEVISSIPSSVVPMVMLNMMWFKDWLFSLSDEEDILATRGTRLTSVRFNHRERKQNVGNSGQSFIHKTQLGCSGMVLSRTPDDH